MDVLYIIGTGSRWFDNELRYSLRSIERFARNLGNVYVCGSDPNILSERNVRFIKCEDCYGSAGSNIAMKISRAIECAPELSDNFLYSSDDHFYVKDTDFGDYPMYEKGDLPSDFEAKGLGGARYTRSLVNTRRMCEALGLPTVAYTHHANFPINKAYWRELLAVWPVSQVIPEGFESLTVYGNYVTKKYGVKSVPRKDCKILNATNNAEILSKIGDREVFSIYDNAVPIVGPFLLNMFPKKSRFES